MKRIKYAYLLIASIFVFGCSSPEDKALTEIVDLIENGKQGVVLNQMRDQVLKVDENPGPYSKFSQSTKRENAYIKSVEVGGINIFLEYNFSPTGILYKVDFHVSGENQNKLYDLIKAYFDQHYDKGVLAASWRDKKDKYRIINWSNGDLSFQYDFWRKFDDDQKQLGKITDFELEKDFIVDARSGSLTVPTGKVWEIYAKEFDRNMPANIESGVQKFCSCPSVYDQRTSMSNYPELVINNKCYFANGTSGNLMHYRISFTLNEGSDLCISTPIATNYFFKVKQFNIPQNKTALFKSMIADKKLYGEPWSIYTK